MAAPPLPQRRLHSIEPCQGVALLSNPAIQHLGSFHRANVAATCKRCKWLLAEKAYDAEALGRYCD